MNSDEFEITQCSLYPTIIPIAFRDRAGKIILQADISPTD
jgi:hypothetical protein